MRVSADRRWAVAWAVADEFQKLVGYPLSGGQPVTICEGCADSDGGPAARGRTPQPLSWSPGDGNTPQYLPDLNPVKLQYVGSF